MLFAFVTISIWQSAYCITEFCLHRVVPGWWLKPHRLDKIVEVLGVADSHLEP